MRSLSSKNGVVKYLCVIDVLKDKNAKNVLHEIAKRKPNKLWIDQGKEFYNNLMQNWLYSAHNKGKSKIAKRFIRTLKSKIYIK